MLKRWFSLSASWIMVVEMCKKEPVTNAKMRCSANEPFWKADGKTVPKYMPSGVAITNTMRLSSLF